MLVIISLKTGATSLDNVDHVAGLSMRSGQSLSSKTLSALGMTPSKNNLIEQMKAELQVSYSLF